MKDTKITKIKTNLLNFDTRENVFENVLANNKHRCDTAPQIGSKIQIALVRRCSLINDRMPPDQFKRFGAACIGGKRVPPQFLSVPYCFAEGTTVFNL